METMYDRLGELLNETLKVGHVQKEHKAKENLLKENAYKENFESKGNEFNSKRKVDYSENKKKPTSKVKKTNYYNESKQKRTGTIIKSYSLQLQRAYRLLDISFSATKEEVRKAYKEKLLYFHPDKYSGNKILEKVATDKTRQIVEAFNLITKYLEE